MTKIFDLTTRGGGNSKAVSTLSADLVSGLVAGIGDSRANTPIAGGGKPLLRLLKSGTWVFGQNDDEVQEGSEWAVNPLSIMHGWSCWSDYGEKTKNVLLGETMVPVTEHRPNMPEALASGEWKAQRSCELHCMNGDDEGTEVLYKTASVGGLRAMDVFLGALQAHLKEDPSSPVAILRLEVDSYKHSQFGQTFVPILEIVGWATMDGERVGELEGPTEDEAETPATTKKKKAPLKAAAATVAPDPDLTVAARVGAPRRQRPAGRA